MNRLILLSSVLLSGAVQIVQAAVVTDGSLGARVALPGVDYAITANLGQQQGTNLFHSFEQFSLETNESATFSGDSSIQNIFSRVTGGQISDIAGTIRSTIPDADLYLMNPAGIMFTQGASLDIQGSFYATTANVIQFSDGTQFNTNIQQTPILSTAEPSAFGFLDNDIGQLDVIEANLTVPVNQSLTLVGGHIDIINAGNIIAKGGQIYIASVASAGTVSLQPEIQPTTTLGNLKIANRSFIDTKPPQELQEFGKGDIFIRAGLFELTGSDITTSTSFYTQGGDIQIQAQDLTLLNSTISSQNKSDKPGGDITINVENKVVLGASDSITATANRSSISTINENVTHTSGERIQAGKSGDIQINAADIHLLDGSNLDSQAAGSGQGGNIILNASNDIVMRGQTNLNQPTRINSSSGVDVNTANAIDIATTNSADLGDGGSVMISAKNMTMNDGANIVVNAYGVGQGGDININLSEKLTLETAGVSGIGNFMSASTASRNTQAGHGGQIVIQAGDLLLADGSFLTSSTTGAGNAGDISVNIKNNAMITGVSDKTDPGILSSARSSSVGGNAGNIQLDVGNQLFLGELSIIDASTFSRGLGGNVSITAGDMVMRNNAYVTATSSSSGNTGNINITITNDNLEMYETSYISTDAISADGGNITISMPNYIYLSGKSQVTTSIRSGVGGGGNINLDTEFTVLDDGQILAQAYGGPGGNIDIVTTSIYNLSQQTLEEAINASSQLGVDGVVTVRSPDTETDEGVIILTGDFLKADELLRSLCNKIRSQGNSLVVTGRESYPNLINDWLPSNATQLVLQRCEL